MSQIPPGPVPPVTKPTRIPWRWPALVLSLVVTVGILIWAIAIRQHTGAASPVVPAGENHISDTGKMVPPQPHIKITHTTSSGGVEDRTGSTEGASIGLHGDNIAASDLKLTATIMSFDGLGAITGGGFGGSFRVSASVGHLLQILAAIFGVVCLLVGAKKIWSPIPDYIHGGGYVLAGIGFIVGAIVPELLGWFGLGSAVVSMLGSMFPAASAKVGAEAQAALGSIVKDLRKANPTLATQIEPDKHEKAIAAAVTKST